MTLVAGVSFIDDIRSLPDSVRLAAQFVAMAMMFYQLDLLHWDMWWMVIVALVVCVGASNIINFMDGVNGITGAYALASLVPLALLNSSMGFVDQSLIYVVVLADVVFCCFNFRPKGKAKCFAGDVGSIGVAYILLFLIGSLVLATGDITWLIFLLVYGVDGCLTICHRIMLHENLGEAHRKHVYQLMANELKIGHVKVSSFYALLQLAVSVGFIFLCPVLESACGLSLVAWHWIYLFVALALLSVAYVLFKMKYYHLHEEYLASLRRPWGGEAALTLPGIIVGLWLEWGGFGYALVVRLFRRCLVVRRVREFWYMEVPSCTEWKINSAMVSFNPNCYVEVGKGVWMRR